LINRVGIRNIYERSHYYARWLQEFGARINLWFESLDSGIDRGHLAPNADFALSSQRWATFYLLNANPQFHLLNKENWLGIEESIRGLTVNGQVNIYTGTRGVLRMENLYDTEINVVLNNVNEPFVPVPEYFWKIVVAPNSKMYAFIGYNIPFGYNNGFNEEYFRQRFCNRSCLDLEFHWLPQQIRQNSKDHDNGYVHCCMYDQEFVQNTGIAI
jgi:hypothetical protein